MLTSDKRSTGSSSPGTAMRDLVRSLLYVLPRPPLRAGSACPFIYSYSDKAVPYDAVYLLASIKQLP